MKKCPTKIIFVLGVCGCNVVLLWGFIVVVVFVVVVDVVVVVAVVVVGLLL